MDQRNESTHERLNRELGRMQLRSAGVWGGWILLVGTVALFIFLNANGVTNVRYVHAIAGDSMPLAAEDRLVIVTRVTVEGTSRDLRMPSQLVYPAKGDEICLRAGEHRFTGHTSYSIVSDTLCDDTSTTPQVD